MLFFCVREPEGAQCALTRTRARARCQHTHLGKRGELKRRRGLGKQLATSHTRLLATAAMPGAKQEHARRDDRCQQYQQDRGRAQPQRDPPGFGDAGPDALEVGCRLNCSIGRCVQCLDARAGSHALVRPQKDLEPVPRA